MFYNNILAPSFKLLGVTLDTSLVSSLVALSLLLFILAVFILTVYFGIGWIGRRGVNARLSALEAELAELKSEKGDESE